MNILIGDDEKLIRIGLIHMLNELYPDCFTYQEARNGEELFSMASSRNPDLIFIDIKMPLCDGLSAMERLRKNGYHGPFLVLTGFSEFDYAKKSIELGASSYLLKPVSPSDLKTAMERVLVQIRELHRLKNESFSRQILQLLSCPAAADTAEFVNQEWKSRYFDEFLFLFDMRKKNSYAALTDELPAQLSRFLGRHAFAPLYYTLFFAPGGEPVLIIQSDAGFTEICSLLTAFLEERRILVSVCHFRHYKVPDALRALTEFQETNNLYTLFPYGAFLSGTGLLELASAQPQLHHFVQIVTAFSFACLEKNETACRQLAKKLQSAVHNLQISRSQLYCLAIHLKNIFPEFSFSVPDSYSDSASGEPCNDSSHCTFYELQDFFQALHTLSVSIPRRRQSSSALLIPQIQDYIHTHYAQELSIEAIADRFDLSPNYVSRLFHEHTGCRFTAYVTGIRIEKACSLLCENPTLSIKAVAEAVGYYSPRYFSKIFQEQMGVLPSEYRYTVTKDAPLPKA